MDGESPLNCEEECARREAAARIYFWTGSAGSSPALGTNQGVVIPQN
jgi:hypothetical protein